MRFNRSNLNRILPILETRTRHFAATHTITNFSAIKKSLSAVLIGLLLIGLPAPLHAAKNPRYAAIVIDAKTGTVLFSRNADATRYPASLTKIMTLYMAFEAVEQRKLTMNQKLKVSKRAAGQAPSKLGLQPGHTISLEDAIKALVTKSANDVATVIAEAISGTEYQFALDMTKRARQLGMNRTRFQNASGLPNRRQTTTARDIALLSQAIQTDYPQYYHYFSLRTFAWGGRKFGTHNNLLKNYSGTTGIKTGYTRASGFNLSAAVSRGNADLIGVVLGGRKASSRDTHMRSILDRSFNRVRKNPNLLPQMVSVPIPRRKPVTIDLKTVVPGQKPGRTISLASLGGPEITMPNLTPDLPTKPIVQFLDQAYRAPEQGDLGPADTTSLWGIQVGAFSQPETARDNIARAQQVVSSELSYGQSVIVPVQSGTRTIYRARFGPLGKTDAIDICAKLKGADMSCFLINDQDWSQTAAGETPD